MIKLAYCLRRLPHLSLEEFQRYWLQKHGPLVRSHAQALRIKRYVQVHTLDHPLNEAIRRSRNAAEPYDGVAELWWESAEEMAAATATPEGRNAARELREDERNFIDCARSSLWIAEEHEVVGGPG
jgi:uncharacterized protein (TIGR02118 family)